MQKFPRCFLESFLSTPKVSCFLCGKLYTQNRKLFSKHLGTVRHKRFPTQDTVSTLGNIFFPQCFLKSFLTSIQGR